MRFLLAALLTTFLPSLVWGQCLTRSCFVAPPVAYSQFRKGVKVVSPPAPAAPATNTNTLSVNLPALPAYGPDWKTEALKSGASLDDIAAYLTTVGTLATRSAKLETVAYGRFPAMFGRAGMTYAGSTETTSSLSYGAGGQTAYVYSLNSVQGDPLAAIDLMVLYQQSAAMGNAQIEGGREAGERHSALVGEAGVHAARIAEVRARTQGAVAVLSATAPAPVTTSTTTRATIEVKPGAAPAPTPVPAPATGPAKAEEAAPPMPPASDDTSALDAAFQKAYAQPQCASCHGGKDPAGKFDISTLSRLNDEGRIVVLSRVLSTEEKVGMPRDKAGKHSPLSAADKRAWMKYLGR